MTSGSERPANVSAYSGGHGGIEPRRLELDGRELEIEVVERWREPQGRFFRVRDDAGGLHLLVVDDDGSWWIRT